MSKKLIAGAGVVASFAIALAPLATFADQASTISDQHTDQLVVNVLPSCTFGSASKTSTDAAYFPGGITHDSSTGDYGASASNAKYEHGATNWNTSAKGGEETSTDASGVLHDGTGNITDHNTGDVASTGYGAAGEGAATAENGLANLSEHTVHRSMMAGTKTDTFAQTTMWVVCNNGGGYTITATATALSNEDTPTAATIPVGNSYSETASGYTLKTIAPTASETDAMTVENANAASYSDTRIAYKEGVSKDNGDSIVVTYGMGIKASQKADTYAGTVTYKLYKGVNAAQNNGD